MAHINKLVMQGFKSFGKKTEVFFDQDINVIIGPNGSGKSNISDALCFVLGRLSVKSMRAAKAKNLIFMGSKYLKPAKEARVELHFDNSDGAFNMRTKEIVLERIVRLNGQSIYKINGETKTRTEIIELLAAAGIDPHGFNIVLQGGIQSIVRVHGDERRKIIEEVAGISIYETRKEKALRELEKTGERLKEIGSILKERTSYLRNLEKEKAEAERFKDLEKTVKRCKASIVSKKIGDKEKELSGLNKSINEKSGQKEKIREETQAKQDQIDELNEKVNSINKEIQKATGVEQDELHEEIANLKAEIEGLRVRKEGYENRREEIERRIEEMEKQIPGIQEEIGDLRDKAPGMAKKAEELKKKKQELEIIESERKKALASKSELAGLRERIKDKEQTLARIGGESESLLEQIEENEKDLEESDLEKCEENIKKLREKVSKNKEDLEDLSEDEKKNEKEISLAEGEIDRNKKIKEDVGKIDTCPLCQSTMTEEHLSHVFSEADRIIEDKEKVLEESKRKLGEINSTKEQLRKDIEESEEKLRKSEVDLVKIKNIEEKKKQLKRIVDQEADLRKELEELDKKKADMEGKVSEVSNVEGKYQDKMLEIEEISSRTEEDVDTSLLYKERELENTKNIIKRSKEDLEDLDGEIGEIEENLENKEGGLENKEKQEEELNKRFNSMFKDRDDTQRKIQESNLELTELQGKIRQVEEQVNYLKIGKAKLDAEKEAMDLEMQEYTGIELLQGSINVLQERLRKSQDSINRIGSINMRALEVYDEVKKEYDVVYEKVETLEKEKEEILKIIEEIDKKKTRSFMKTFKAINELFSKNFAKLSVKGASAALEIENKEDIFDGGVNINVKLSRGKNFDVSSLSGGEQTLIALSLLFAIQEHRPYHFYIFDEIDAALDKRNSERLAALLNQSMKKGQYIVVTHNDAIIMDANFLYGVSMHDGLSKILSLKIDEGEKEEEIKN